MREPNALSPALPDARTRKSELIQRLRETVSGRVRVDEPLAAHTTLKVGGPATAFVRAETVDDVVAVARVCTELRAPWLILGRGSNLLVADDGWPGVVVTLGRGFRGVHIDGEMLEAGGAEPMPMLAHVAARAGLSGLEFGVAIPGSLGGAVRMNAGAMGASLSDVLRWADVVSLIDGTRRRIPAAQLQMRYRRTDLPPDAVVIAAGMRLRREDPDTLAAQLKAFKQWRREHQPINEPSCGSVFRNPQGDSAGRLVEAAGCKGRRIGGAQVSPRHANFITVTPGATAADVARLIAEVRDAVERRHGVTLEPEVVFAGFTEDCPAGPEEVAP